MSRISSRSKAVTVTVLGPVLAFSLVACGGGSSGSGSAAPADAPNPSASGAPGGGRGFNGAEFTKIQACLKAAGIAVPTRSNFPRPSGSFSPRARPSGVRPSGVRPSGGNFRGGGEFASPQVQAALKACGITIPSGGGRPNATPTS
jgi:hypothetical protein